MDNALHYARCVRDAELAVPTWATSDGIAVIVTLPAGRVGDGARVLGLERRPPDGPESRQRAGELAQVETIVRHPGNQQVESRELAEPAVGNGGHETLGGHRGEKLEARRPAVATLRHGPTGA